MSQYLNEPLIFLIEVIFGLYIMMVMLRFLFQLLKVDFYNPVSQVIVKLTNPPLRILRRAIPSIGKIDTSSIVLMLALQYLSFSLIVWIANAPFFPVSLLILSLVELLNLVFNVFIFSIILLAIFSWFPAGLYQNPLATVLGQLTRSVMKPARRMLPPAGGVDLSPMLVLIALFFLKLLFIPPLKDLARYIAL